MDSALLGASLALSFLVTYLAHSTLLLGGAWVLGRALRERALPVQDLAWKVALVGGFVTAAFRVATQALERPVAVAVETLATGDFVLLRSAIETPAPHPGLSSLAGQLAGWERLLLLGWSAGALVGLLLLAQSWRRLRHCLASRESLEFGPVREALDDLLVRAERPEAVRLSDAPTLPVPVALGVFSPEICLPTRVVEELGEGARVAVLAHELGHVVRRDPTWLLVARTIESVFFVQPLNRLARRRLQALSEYLADAWALEATGDRRGLAQCLVEVAGWLRPETALLAPGMAGARGQLTARVERILDRAASESRPVRSAAKLAFAGALGFIAVFAPGMAPPPMLEPAPVAAAEDGDRVAAAAESPGPQAPRRSSSPAVDEAMRSAIADGIEGGIDDGVEQGLANDWEDAILDGSLGGLDALEIESLEGALAGALEGGYEDAVAGALASLDSLEPLEMAQLDGALAVLAKAGALGFDGEGQALEELERRRPSPEEIERLEAAARELAEKIRPSKEDIERLRVLARELSERSQPSREEIERLRAEVRALAERSRPSREERERLRAKAKEMAEHARPKPEEIEKLRAEALRQVERHRLRTEDLQRLRAGTQALAEKARERSRKDRERIRIELRDKEVDRHLRRQRTALTEESLAAEEQRLEEALAKVRKLRAEAVQRHEREGSEEPEPPKNEDQN
jgi:beta-lactamase regulating signal transducer with metallopeptidase domain